jgi:hypothetical protein
MNEYFSAVADVVEAGKNSLVSTQNWKNDTEAAREKAEKAMAALLEHRRNHCC